MMRKALLSLCRASRCQSPRFSPVYHLPSTHSRFWATLLRPTHLHSYCHGHCYFSTTSSNPDDPVSLWKDSNIAHEITSRGWHISEDIDGDWRSNAAAIARSLQLIKGRMKVHNSLPIYPSQSFGM